MMLLTSYIGRAVLKTILLSILVFMGLEIFISFVTELPDIGSGHYDIHAATLYVLLSMPSELYTLFPMASLLGSVIGLGLLADRHELMVMRASGFSKGQIAYAAMRMAFLVMVLMTCLGELVGPPLQHIAMVTKNVAENGASALTDTEGLWFHEGNEFVHVDTVFSHDYLRGVLIYTFNDQHQLLKVTKAHSAVLIDKTWELQQVDQTTLFMRCSASS